MDRNFKDWENENKDFCKKARAVEIRILYLMQCVQDSADVFVNMIKASDKNYQEVDLNRIINKLSSIRTYIRHLKDKKNTF